MRILKKIFFGTCLCLCSFGVFSAPVSNNTGVLFNWDNGEGQTMADWLWSDDIAYGNPGWLLQGGDLGAPRSYSWGMGARSFKNSGYGEKATAELTTSERAPSTSEGGSLWIHETPDSTFHVTSWWVWYDGRPLIDRGVTNNSTDRMSFYLKTTGMDGMPDDGGSTSIKANFHIGTYLCWDAPGTAYGTGDGCPYEGPGNQHYYHYLAINPGGWIHVLLDQHPQHLRVTGHVSNNPAYAKDGKNYFAQMNQYYMEIRYPHANPTGFYLDELEYYSTQDTVEPQQNEDSITSLWVGYWPTQDHWEIGFHDESFGNYGDGTQSTFEVRWSTSPITNANFENATLIDPMFYGGVEHTGVEKRLRRVDSWNAVAWTRFKLPSSVQSNNNQLYFAVKDVSVSGGHVGTKWPWKKTSGDGHNAPNSFIKTIDYHLRADGAAGGGGASLPKYPPVFNANKVE